MADGMRRPPRLWEQKLERMVRNLSGGAGVTASAGAADQGTAPGPGGPGESVEPTPVVDDDPTTPRLPATPSVFAAIGGLSILWTGLDDEGAPFPSGTTVQVHVSTTSGFTPSSGTLEGVIRAGERIVVTGLTSGTTHYVKFVLVAPDGTIGETSAQASLAAGFVLSTNIGTGEITADLVSFDASAIGGIQQFVGTATPPTTGAEGSTWINTSNGSYYTLTGGSWVQRQWGQAAISAGAISTTQLAAGAITAGSAIIANAAISGAQIASATITDANIQSLSATKITTGTLSGDRISGGTIQGSTIVTRADGYRVRLKDGGAGGTDHLEFLSGSTVRGRIFATDLQLGIEAPQDVTLYNIGGSPAFANLQVNQISAAAQASFDGQVISTNINSNPQSGNPAVGINTTSSRLRRDGSSQKIKYDIAAIRGSLSPTVDQERQLDVITSDPYDLLRVAVVEFSAIDDEEPSTRRLVGFIAEDMDEKYPLGVTRDADGSPLGIETQGVLAGLVAIVQDQQQTINDLTARLDALEA